MYHLLEQLAFWFIGMLTLLHLLTVWFDSELPTHLARTLCKWDKRRLIDWPDGIISMSRDEIEIWAILRYPKTGELLSCPVCLSQHLAWVSALIIIPFWGLPFITTALAGILTWPGLVNRMRK